jgi:molybdate transport system regulatory protein
MAKMRARKTRKRQEENAGYRINGRIWLEKDGELFMGWGRVILLQRIHEMGSIAAAARSMKLGYRNAWLWIDSMNKLAPEPLVIKEAGGEKGGYARVTEAGLKAIEQYKELRERFLELVDNVE